MWAPSDVHMFGPQLMEDDEESWCTDEPVQPDWIVVQASIDDDE